MSNSSISTTSPNFARLAQLKNKKQILETEQDISDLDPNSIKARTERLKQIKALIEAQLAAEEAAEKK